MKYFTLICLSLMLFSCTSEEKTTENSTKVEAKEELIVIKDGVYTEYYPGKKSVKIQGQVNEKEEREGKWHLLSTEGKELSVTFYDAGKRNGHSIVRYPNGAIHYVGEYKDNKEVGIWKFYNPDGSLKQERNFDKP